MRLSQIFPRQPLSTVSLHGFGNDVERTPRHWPTVVPLVLVIIVFLAGYFILVLDRGMIELELETDTRTVLKVYWHNEDGLFSEKDMAQILIKPGKCRYTLRVTNTSATDFLRLDPSEKTAWITIKRLTVRQWGFPDYTLKDRADFDNLQVIAGVKSLTRLDQGVTVQVKGRDPQLKLILPKMERQVSGLADLARIIGVVLLATVCFFVFRFFFRTSFFIPVLAAFTLALILVMASITGENTHPDEYVHLAAGKYYENHTLPPRVGDPAIQNTYSLYGMSRLHSGEIVYPLAGKFLQFLKPLQMDRVILLRLFNVLLFASLVCFTYKKADFRFFLLPFLISPQIWYVFSYFNSDAFATFIGLLAGYQLAAEKSALATLLWGKESDYNWLKILLLGVLFGLLLLLKKNFYVLYLFFFFYFIWKIWLLRPVWTRKSVFRFAAVVVVGCTLFIAFRGTDAWVNDFDKKEMMFEARRQHAAYLFNPDTPLEHKHAYLQMRERGASLKRFLELDRWGEKSFYTAFGDYGYAQYPGSFVYYNYVRYTGLLLLLTLIVSVAWQGKLPGILLATLSLVMPCLLIVVACYHAWTVDFQAQGRYLLPIIPIFAVLLYHGQRVIYRPLFYSLFLIMFSLSVYNFIMVGLRDIGKYVI